MPRLYVCWSTSRLARAMEKTDLESCDNEFMPPLLAWISGAA